MIAFSINAERGYVIISVTGAPTPEEYTSACRALAEHESFRPAIHRICDFTQADSLSVSTKDLLAFVEEARTLPKARTAKTALIGKDENDRGLMQLFASHFETGYFKVFRSGMDALNWVLKSASVAVQESATVAGSVRSHQIRVHRLSGVVTPDQVVALQSSWINDEGFAADAPVIWDLRDTMLKVNMVELDQLAAKMFAHAQTHRPAGKSAVIVSTKLHAMMLEGGFTKGIELGRTRIFFSEDQARDWLLGA